MGRQHLSRAASSCIGQVRPADPVARPVCITSTVPDCLNSNASIRHHLAEGFRTLLPRQLVIEPGFHTAADAIARTRPSLIIAVGGLAIDAVDLASLRRAADQAGAPLALWLHDDPYEFDYSFKARGLADVVFTNDSWCLPHYGPGPAFHLPLAASPAVHFREVLPPDGRDIDLFFCGVGYPNRVNLLRRAQAVLQRHACVVRGDSWPADLGFAANQRLTTAEFCDHAQRALLTLNLGRDHNVANRRLGLPATTPGPRTFEVALAGSAQIAFSEGLEILDHFAAGSEILLVDSIDDLREAVQRGLDEPGMLVEMARRAQRRALAGHTYANRAATIIEHLHAIGMCPAMAPDQLDRPSRPPGKRVPTLRVPSLHVPTAHGQARVGGKLLAIR